MQEEKKKKKFEGKIRKNEGRNLTMSFPGIIMHVSKNMV